MNWYICLAAMGQQEPKDYNAQASSTALISSWHSFFERITRDRGNYISNLFFITFFAEKIVVRI